MKTFLSAALAALFVFGLTACERETEIETTPGEPTEIETDMEIGIPAETEAAIDEAAADAEAAMDEAAADAEAAMDEAGAAVEDAAADTEAAVDAAAEEMDGDGN